MDKKTIISMNEEGINIEITDEKTNILENEIKRLARLNDLLEKELDKSNTTNLAIHELIQKNTSTMCEIAEVM